MNVVKIIIVFLILVGIITWVWDWITLPYKVDTTNALLKEILEELNERYS